MFSDVALLYGCPFTDSVTSKSLATAFIKWPMRRWYFNCTSGATIDTANALGAVQIFQHMHGTHLFYYNMKFRTYILKKYLVSVSLRMGANASKWICIKKRAQKKICIKKNVSLHSENLWFLVAVVVLGFTPAEWPPGVRGVKFLPIERKTTSMVHPHQPSHYSRKHAPGWLLAMLTILALCKTTVNVFTSMVPHCAVHMLKTISLHFSPMKLTGCRFWDGPIASAFGELHHLPASNKHCVVCRLWHPNLLARRETRFEEMWVI